MNSMKINTRQNTLRNKQLVALLLAVALPFYTKVIDLVLPRGSVSAAPYLSTIERQAQIEDRYRSIIRDLTDLEAFAQLSETAAALADGEDNLYLIDLNRFLLGASGQRDALWAGPWGRVRSKLHQYIPWIAADPSWTRFGSSGFAADDGSNQVQHFWYSVALAYSYGPTLADWAARYHEWNAPGLLRFLPGTGNGCGSEMDLALSRQGIALGYALREGTIQLGQVAGWLRAELAG